MVYIAISDTNIAPAVDLDKEYVMAATRGTRKGNKSPEETPEVSQDEKVQDQTPEEAEEAAAIAAEDTLDHPQSEGEALLANAIAEEDTVENQSSEDEENVMEAVPSEDGKVTVRVVRSGLMLAGRVYSEGATVQVSEEMGNQSEEDQKKFYGEVFYKRV